MTRINIFITVLALIWPALFLAQKHDYVWEFGDDELIHPDFGGTTFDFNFNPIDIYRTPRQVAFGTTNASFADAEGNLLYYTNGCAIYNNRDFPVDYGYEINPGFLFDLLCLDKGGYPSKEGAMFFPVLNQPKHALLLHQSADTLIAPAGFLDLGSLNLYYSLVGPGDGDGIALKKNETVLRDTFITGFMAAVKHADLERWWVIMHGKYNNEMFKFLVSDTTVDLHSKQYSGLSMGTFSDAANQAVFTPDGTMLLSYNQVEDLQIWDFDRSTGHLSNFRHVAIQDSATTGGIAISPNGRFIYVVSDWDLYQFDLWAKNLAESQIHIGHYDGFLGPFPTRFAKAQLGPDCRIYILSVNGDRWMHIIHHPNRKGKACDFRQHDLRMPTVKGTIPVPNFPNYRLDTGPVCDSSLMLTAIPTIPRLAHVKIYPNPTSGQITIESGDLSQSFTDVVVYDMMGREVLQQDWSGVSDLQLDLDDAPGTYFVVIREEGEVVITDTVVVN